MASRNGASASALALSSDEVNYLVYRYMQESGAGLRGGGARRGARQLGARGDAGGGAQRGGLRTCPPSPSPACRADPVPPLSPLARPRAAGFHHASFTFAHESQVHRTSIDPNLVPAGALVAFIQRGMQYMEMEANIEVGWGPRHGGGGQGGRGSAFPERARLTPPRPPPASPARTASWRATSRC
jgi:hypothetical protein